VAIQIKFETGSKKPLEDIVEEVQQMLDSWKNVSYQKAWAYMQACSKAAVTEWKVTNPWGRSRRFAPTTNRSLLASYEREGSNFNIQSSVADTCNLAVAMLLEERSRRGLTFLLCNQVHDAIMALVRKCEIEKMKQLFRDTMGNIPVPIKGREPLILGIDLEVMSRWGVGYKEAA
jgi:DNA polymerase I-like protein with 3'-5' exonuclease and polymerase domains